jgi:protein phosphatase
MKITIPELALVVLIGSSGSGKSTFAHTHFKATEVLSSDACRAMVSDDENNQGVSKEAFEVLHFIAAKRLAGGRLTVVDATNVQKAARAPLVELARAQYCLPVAIVLDLPERICHERNQERSDRAFGPHVIQRQSRDLRQSLRHLEKEGFRHVHVLRSPEEIADVEIVREPLWNNRKAEHGPFDIIGDIHGCYAELVQLLERLGYAIAASAETGAVTVTPPAGRKAVFLGDLVDRGPDTPAVLRLVMGMVAAGTALCVPGNHDTKLLKKLSGRNVQVTHGLAESLAQLTEQPPEFSPAVREFLNGLVSHYVLDDGKLVVAHAGMKEKMQGRAAGKVREFALYGETTGETDEFGLPVRYNWAAEYRGRASVVYGHTPVPAPEWLNNTINIDTGCVFGGGLTALRYPERELVTVPAAQEYAVPARPLRPAPAAGLSAQQQQDDLLDLSDVLGKRLIETALHPPVTIREENAITALEVMSRFALPPQWLIYLPPTMSPPETSQREGLLEHPAEAFEYYRKVGVGSVVCEAKHMGSRAVVVVCRDEAAAQARFGSGAIGVCYTRTGRRFFNDEATERAFLARVQAALGTAGFWERFNTGWVALDCELMPWSAKAQDLIRSQYAAVGAAGRLALGQAADLLEHSVNPPPELAALRDHTRTRLDALERYVQAYRGYCWPVESIDDLKLAPFHLLASEGAVHTGQTNVWHMQTLAELAQADPGLIVATEYRLVELADEASVAAGVAWWEELTGRGGEGMVVKPLDFLTTGQRGLVQPAVKCRGPEYLRIIYGPEYALPANLERLRSRGLGAKRSLALREFALGIEGLNRFVAREPLRRVHECVFGVLALESEPVDPRL